MVSRALLTSRSDEWFTPAHVLECVRRLDDRGRIALDPCWHPDCLVRAEHTRSAALGEDGLELDWRALVGPARMVFVNPPYSAIGKWLARCAQHRGEVVALVPARTDTRWFHSHALSASAACFIKGRLKFANAGTRYSAPFPSVLLYWGRKEGLFRVEAEPLGWCVDPDGIPF